jgi:hypothetical protein
MRGGTDGASSEEDSSDYENDLTPAQRQRCTAIAGALANFLGQYPTANAVNGNRAGALAALRALLNPFGIDYTGNGQADGNAATADPANQGVPPFNLRECVDMLRTLTLAQVGGQLHGGFLHDKWYSTVQGNENAFRTYGLGQ